MGAQIVIGASGKLCLQVERASRCSPQPCCLVIAFVGVELVTNSVLNQLISRPMREMSRKAEEASVTPATVSFDERSRSDEIGLLARSFERMKQSLAISMQMLKDRQRASYERCWVGGAAAAAGRASMTVDLDGCSGSDRLRSVRLCARNGLSLRVGVVDPCLRRPWFGRASGWSHRRADMTGMRNLLVGAPAAVSVVLGAAGQSGAGTATGWLPASGMLAFLPPGLGGVGAGSDR